MDELLDAARDWLQRQTGLRPGPSGRARLVAQIRRWIDQHGTTACGRRLNAAEPLYAQCAAKLWQCWEYHWRQAAEAALGFRKPSMTYPCPSHSAADKLGVAFQRQTWCRISETNLVSHFRDKLDVA
jgi:hypothetical protein